jgi:hypothetical protein
MSVNSEIVNVLVDAISALNVRVDDVFSQQAIQQAVIDANSRTDQKLDVIIGSQIKDAAESWLRDNITQPENGKDGVDGKDGKDGRTPTDAEIKLAVEIWFEINKDDLRGKDGVDGKDGRDGRNGVDGKNGKDGKAGANGTDGVGIALVEQRDENSFYITLTDGQEFQIELPQGRAGSFYGGGGGGIREITSTDNTVIITPTQTGVDLSVTGGGGGITTNVFALVRNSTGQTIPKGAAVYISGATGQTSNVSLALATSDATSAQTLGVASAAIPNNSTGYILTFGYLSNVNTSAYTDGQQLYLSPTVAGGLTAVKPLAPNHLVYVAVVEYANPNNGKLFVKVQNGYELDEIHDVAISSLAEGHTLRYDASTSLWRNVPASSGGTVTSVNVSGGTTGLTFGGGPIIASGTITISGTLGTSNGGTGSTTLTGYIKGTGTDALQAVTGIPASDISTPIDCGTFE